MSSDILLGNLKVVGRFRRPRDDVNERRHNPWGRLSCIFNCVLQKRIELKCSNQMQGPLRTTELSEILNTNSCDNDFNPLPLRSRLIVELALQ